MVTKLIKKLNNFKFTALVAACISGVAAIYGLFAFFMFHFAGDLFSPDSYLREVGFYEHESGGFLSFLVFLGFFISVICGIIVSYSMVPFIKNKEKMMPRKGVLLVGFVGGVFELLLVILMILLLAEPNSPNTMVGIIISLPFGVVSAIGQLCFLFPYLKCNFYMPEVKKQ